MVLPTPREGQAYNIDMHKAYFYFLNHISSGNIIILQENL